MNLFLPGDVHKKELHRLHFDAWKKGMKSLYYCRSSSIQRAEKVSHTVERDNIEAISKDAKEAANDDGLDNTPAVESAQYEECLACQ